MGPCRNNLRSFLLLLLHCSWSRSGEVLELGSDFLRLFPAGFPDHLSPFVLLAGAWLSAAAGDFALRILLNFWTCLSVQFLPFSPKYLPRLILGLLPCPSPLRVGCLFPSLFFCRVILRVWSLPCAAYLAVRDIGSNGWLILLGLVSDLVQSSSRR